MGVIRKAWNAIDDARLARLWNEGEMCLEEIATAVGHPPSTTYERARSLGLKAPAPEGWELLSHAAKRAGFEPQTLRRILHHFGATVRRALTKPFASAAPAGSTHIRLHYIVHPREVDAAVEHWMQTETVAEAARRFGTNRSTLYRRLVLAGVKRRRQVGRPSVGSRPEWRVTPEDVERAMAIKVPMGRRPRGPVRPGDRTCETEGRAA